MNHDCSVNSGGGDYRNMKRGDLRVAMGKTATFDDNSNTAGFIKNIL